MGQQPGVWLLENATDTNKNKHLLGIPRVGGEKEISIRTDNMESNQAFYPRTTAMICHCRKICKNIRGWKIHQARMKCQVETSQRQRTGAASGETQEAQGREAHHSAQSLQAEAQVSPKTSNTDQMPRGRG